MKMSELHSDMTRVLQIYADQYGHAIGVAIQDTPSLRDQFAMAALTGLLSNPKLTDTALKKGPRWFDEVAYQYADGMLKEREAK